MGVTVEQQAAIDSRGKVIVSASAGSGKTFVMIKKLVEAIADGADLDCVLAVTFTKKAAAQIKEKLRSALIEKMSACNDTARAHIKSQLSKIPSAAISTIHAFCARLLRTYFYALDIDGTFDIISSDDASAKDYKRRALDGVFEKLYEEDDGGFLQLLKCYRKKRSDGYLRALVLDCYEKLRVTARYQSLLDGAEKLYTEEGFKEVLSQLSDDIKEKCAALKEAVTEFAAGFNNPHPAYEAIFGEMLESLEEVSHGGIFDPAPPLTKTRKPADKEDKEEGERFKAFKESLLKRYNALRGEIADEQTERRAFFESGKTAVAFCNLLKQFDAAYTAIKRDENKLDYNDLEHLTLALLEDKQVRAEINGRFTLVFVDEYQDVNPVQEELISKIGAENIFLVGDVKQAIYGFRGSRSLFFAEKYNSFEGGGGSALRLSHNFRSSDGVLDFVNALFSQIMTSSTCGFDYAAGSKMISGGGYPAGYGSSEIHLFGKDEEDKSLPEVYSVKSGAKRVRHSREGLAVLSVVERELKGKHYDLASGSFVDTQAGDICILTRKRNAAANGIVRALSDAGYSVAGSKEQNICTRPEVRQMIDILSYIDNSEQDVPLVSALLSPLGGLDCDALAAIRIAYKGEKRMPFRECCERYLSDYGNETARKLYRFKRMTARLKELSDVLSAAEIIDKILQGTSLEAAYSAGGGEKLKNLRRLAKEGENLSVSEFLAKLKDTGYDIPAPPSASSDSIKVMTMHASKGLEFPIVIIADVCATFKGRNDTEMPFDESFGFAPKCHDAENMLVRSTLLRRLTLARTEAEELKNELNLFYVACTRAMCRLHVMAEECKEYSSLEAADAKCYAKLFDMTSFSPEELPPRDDFTAGEKVGAQLKEPDKRLLENLKEKFMRVYPHEEGVNLPVKSSASKILRLSEHDYFRPAELFEEDGGETGTERGTAY
ncbi:MAG: UvrD-helicase domain-containing protein, partial [Clostridia bacterium]|nr:UvrD-helicase domain-containing protein [Clostridia bacterium]